MVPQDGATQEPAMMHCKACAEKIPANAKRCKHCGSYQGIRRHLDTLNFSIALGIAFLSLLVLLSKEIIIPTFLEFFSGKSFGMKLYGSDKVRYAPSGTFPIRKSTSKRSSI